MTQYGPVPDFPVKGKIVAITGGGSGIGFALAELCHRNGARVLIGDLKLTGDAEKYVSQVSKNEVAFQHCDVSSWQSLHDLITASINAFGDVPDVYVPCAGVFQPKWSDFWHDDEADAYKTIQINVNHPVKLTRLALRALAGAEKQGVVCLVASTAGIRGNYFASIYATSKHAIVGFAKSMGEADVEEGVRVSCICPGMVESPLWLDRDDNVMEEAKYKDRKALKPADIAEVMLKMIERAEYNGGTCVLKTPFEERVFEEGAGKEQGYDPSPRPSPDLTRIKELLAKDRGKKWVA